MATAIAGVSLAIPKLISAKAFSLSSPPDSAKSIRAVIKNPQDKIFATFRCARRCCRLAVAAAAPDKLSEKVAESVKTAEEACAGDPKSGECAAAWDEVEELSAAASHARDRKKEADVLEDYCKDNPETEECRTYDD